MQVLDLMLKMVSVERFLSWRRILCAPSTVCAAIIHGRYLF